MCEISIFITRQNGTLSAGSIMPSGLDRLHQQAGLKTSPDECYCINCSCDAGAIHSVHRLINSQTQLTIRLSISGRNAVKSMGLG